MLVSHFTTLYPFLTSAFPRKQHKASADTEVMSQGDIDAFIESVRYGTLTPQGVTTAVARGIPVNGRNSGWNTTALYYAVRFERRELVVALLAAGADANVKNRYGETSVWKGAFESTADILQLVINGGGNVNEPNNYGEAPLIAVGLWNKGNAPGRLQVLLACPELDLDATYQCKTAEQWAATADYPELVVAIAQERRRRERWSNVRCAWVAAIARS